MITVVFIAFLLLSMTVALIDWRRGWLMAIVCGVLQDPVRKLTPGTPVILIMSTVTVYVIALFAASGELQRRLREFTRRFSNVHGAFIVVLLFLVLAAVRGVFTYGMGGWQAPALSLFVYLAPVPAILLGFTYLRREEAIYAFFRFYAVVTSVALTGTLLEYFGMDLRVLGMVAATDLSAMIRHLPGIQIRMISGFYRGPDIMGWHAAMLAIIGITMAMRRQTLRRSWMWIALTAWGMLNCLLSGRRKAVYMVAVFVAVFLWRYVRQLKMLQVVALVLVFAAVGGVIYKIAHDEQANIYTRGTVTSSEEVLGRLEGGLFETVRQYGFLGAGLGAATQGVHHFHLVEGGMVGWQEGGLGKLAIELGIPGLIAVVFFAFALGRLMLLISAHPDVEGSSQLIRCALFGAVVANIIEFLVSAQAYSDPVLTLMTAFLLGCLLATGVLDERLHETTAATAPPSLARATS